MELVGIDHSIDVSAEFLEGQNFGGSKSLAADLLNCFVSALIEWLKLNPGHSIEQS